jgi:hypothetical protein
LTSKEIVSRTIRFQGAERLPYDFPEKYGSDFYWTGMSPSPDDRPRKGVDEWGAVWDNIGNMSLGEVKDFPLKDWKDFDKLNIPDINKPSRWKHLENIREQAGDKFILANGITLYERVHFVRGLENTWMDIYDHPDELGKLIDFLVEMSISAIKKFAALGVDGYIFPDDWGLQNRLMIAPEKWREIWKPRYARIFKAVHDAGMLAFLHSCGYIVDILDDLIEIGLDVIQMDQQENMGLELIGERFGGRITFYCPVDIQNTMVYGSLDDIRAYCRKMVKSLGRSTGGFIPKWYSDPVGAGHRQEAIESMCEEFFKFNQEMWTNHK